MDTHNATEEIRIMSAFSKKFLPTLSYAISASLPNFSKSRDSTNSHEQAYSEFPTSSQSAELLLEDTSCRGKRYYVY